MKKMLLACLFIAVLAPRLFAQTWEVVYSNPSLNNSSGPVVFPAPNNGVRLAAEDVWTDQTTFFNFNALGEFQDSSKMPNTTGWTFLNGDAEGSTYWWTPYTVKKLNSDGQLVWNYNSPQSAGSYWVQTDVRGHTFFQGFQNGDHVGELDENGQLVNTFPIPMTYDYFPGLDGSLIYSTEINPNDVLQKQDKNHQIVWEKTFVWPSRILGGSMPDGSTYLSNENGFLEKLGPAGQTAWMIDLETYWPATNWAFLESISAVSDGNLLLVLTGYDSNTGADFPILVKISATDGHLIWARRLVNFEFFTTTQIMELPDGGFLLSMDGWESVLLVRTDKNGNTLASQIRGNIRREQNNDCLAQTSEPPMAGISVIAKSGSKTYSGTSDGDGFFEINVSQGDYALKMGQLGSYWNICNSPLNASITSSTDTVEVDLGAKALVDCPQMVHSVGSPVFRRCFDNNYLTFNYQNIGTSTAFAAEAEIKFDPKLYFKTSTKPVAWQSGQTFGFALGDVEPGAGGSFKVTFQVDCDATLGELLCVETLVRPDTNCSPTAFLSLSENDFCLPVVASFDPNDKTAFVNGRPETAKIQPDSSLEYLIRFQNTGNDTAFNIVVLDTLSSFHDAASVVPGASSHLYEFSLIDGNVLRFSFKNVLLPDSNVNEAASHGFVKFFVRQSATNKIGDPISNSAAIFFDFNAPVITNKTGLLVSPVVSQKSSSTEPLANIWPNPATDRAHVQLKNWNEKDGFNWSLSDATGRVVRTGRASASAFFIDRKALPGGIYLLRAVSKNGQSALGKVIFE